MEQIFVEKVAPYTLRNGEGENVLASKPKVTGYDVEMHVFLDLGYGMQFHLPTSYVDMLII